MPVFDAKAEAHSASSGATSVEPAPFNVVVSAEAPAVKPADAPMARAATDSDSNFLGWKAGPFKGL